MNKIPYDERTEVYTQALFIYGHRAQMVVAIEKLSEVQKELCKVMRDKGDLEHLAEEIADATIMLEQMRYFLGLDEKVCMYMDEKLQIEHRPTKRVLTVYGLFGTRFLVYDTDYEWWVFVPIDECRPVAGKEK